MPPRAKKESELTTSRKTYLTQLKAKLAKNPLTAILAQHGNGKTRLLKELEKDKDFFYMDLKRIATSPENFAVDFIGTVCFFLKHKDSLQELQDIDTLKSLTLKPGAKNIIEKVDNELQKIKPDQKFLVDLAFRFADIASSEAKKQIVISIDNFEEILALNNFSSINNIHSIFADAVADNKHAKFIIASSSVNTFKKLLKSQDKVQTLDLSGFSLEEIKEVFERQTGKNDDRILKEVLKLTNGAPLAVTTLAALFKDVKTGKTEDIAKIDTLLTKELCTTTSRLYDYSQSLYLHSLGRARGAALLKTILKVLSQNPPLRLTEVARLIYRSGPVTKSLLERLIEVDLVTKSGNTFDFANPVLKQWCSLMFRNIEFEESPDDETLKKAGGIQ